MIITHSNEQAHQRFEDDRERDKTDILDEEIEECEKDSGMFEEHPLIPLLKAQRQMYNFDNL